MCLLKKMCFFFTFNGFKVEKTSDKYHAEECLKQ